MNLLSNVKNSIEKTRIHVKLNFQEYDNNGLHLNYFYESTVKNDFVLGGKFSLSSKENTEQYS